MTDVEEMAQVMAAAALAGAQVVSLGVTKSAQEVRVYAPSDTEARIVVEVRRERRDGKGGWRLAT